MAWDWVAAQLSGMAAGEFKLISTNTPNDVKLARTRANFDAGNYFTNDAHVVSVIGANVSYAFSAPAINGDTGVIINRGGGHTDGGDGSIYRFNPSTLAWELYLKSPRYDSTNPTISCNITAITPGTPPRLTVDADIVISGDQGVISGTTDADGTYQLVRIDATHVDLYNIDGDVDGPFTVFAGAGLTDSTGTLTITWNPEGIASPGDAYAHTNADGEQMPPLPHTYHCDLWIGGNVYMLGGHFVFGPNGGSVERLWFLDEDGTPKVTRGYHDAEAGNGRYLTVVGGAGRGVGPIAYNPFDGRVYTGDGTPSIYSYLFRRWSSDFLSVEYAGDDGANGFEGFHPAVVLPQPGGATKRMFFSPHSTTQFDAVTDIEGVPSMDMANSFSDGALFATGMLADPEAWAIFYDDLNDEIIYWGAGSTIGAITPDADLSKWTSAEVNNGLASGDTPSDTGGTAYCAGCKVPDHDAYLLVQGGNVYLYARSASLGGAVTVKPAPVQKMDRGFVGHIVSRLGGHLQ